MPSRPSVTVIVLNYNGERHLEACLGSLAAQDYPAMAVMVADNGSSDRSLALVRSRFPAVRTLAIGQNLGFAGGYNRAVAEAEGDAVVLLNNDTRVAPTWLSELVDAAERHGAAAAASAILDWDGSRIDFVGGIPTFVGHSWQLDHGHPVGKVYDEKPLLFGCGASVLIRREAYLEAGGFDEDYFAYFEDVDLGWRLNLLGHKTVLAPRAITYHRLHGSFGGMAHALRLRLYERNALATIVKNYGDEALARVLPAAVALTLARNLLPAKLDREAIRFGAPSPEHAALPSAVVAALIGLEDFARWLPALRAKRERVQRARRVSDTEILQLLPEPLALHDLGTAYHDAAWALIRDFGIDRLITGSGSLTQDVPEAAAQVQPVVVSTGREAVPRVSIVVLTASGATHLGDCLTAIRGHNWPATHTEVIVVDNGSATDPTADAERLYPGVKVVRTGHNLGFSAGNNAGARAASGDWLVFLNDDTRVAPDWLDELIRVAHERQAAAVGALMVDWSGERLDFAGGLVNFEGRGYALQYDEPRQSLDNEARPVLFGCGGAVMVRRDVFQQSGGWDEPTFMYYEDVELGWRLWLLGHEVWLAPRAVVYHKHHGTSGSTSPARIRAFERNGLRMIYALLEDDTLRRALPAALLLAADRVLLGTPFSRAHDGETGSAFALPTAASAKASLRHALIQRGARRYYGVGGNLRKLGIGGLAGAALDTARDLQIGWTESGARNRYLIERSGQAAALEGRRERVNPETLAALLGIEDFLGMLPELSPRRAWIQARRKRSDAEIFARFGGRWADAVPSARLDLHVELRGSLMDVLDISLPPRSPRASDVDEPSDGH